MDGHTNRRGFLGIMASVAGAGALGGTLGDVTDAGVAVSSLPGNAAGPWDLSWIDALRGKHKQVFASRSVALRTSSSGERLIPHAAAAPKCANFLTARPS